MPRGKRAKRPRIAYYLTAADDTATDDPDRPLPAHVERYRCKREPPTVPVMCANIWCRSWVWGDACERCGTVRA